jgi:hypothetical protein
MGILTAAAVVGASAMMMAGGQRGAGSQNPVTGQTSAAPAKPPADPRDLSGIWGRFGRRDLSNRQGAAGFPEGGDTGFGLDVPPLTAEGQKMFDAIKPGNGRPLGSAPQPGEPEGRRRAVIEKFQNDPTALCTPSGLTRIILATYFAPMELIMAKDRVIQHFEWAADRRTIYTDGRKLPTEVSLPAWNGFSVGQWEGDTLVVNSFGFHENTWLDHFGYPHSDQMRLEERYRLISEDRLQLNWTVTDPKVYTRPFVGQTKVFRRLAPDESTVEEGWVGLFDNRCVPEEEFAFNEKIRNPAGGKTSK